MIPVVTILKGTANRKQADANDEQENRNAGRRFVKTAEGKNAGSDRHKKQDRGSQQKGHTLTSYI
jgi:hypothetical protein